LILWATFRFAFVVIIRYSFFSLDGEKRLKAAFCTVTLSACLFPMVFTNSLIDSHPVKEIAWGKSTKYE